MASGPERGAYAVLGYGPGTNGPPLTSISSRFHVSICIGAPASCVGLSIICAYGGA